MNNLNNMNSENKSIYGNQLAEMKKTMEEIRSHIETAREKLRETVGMDPVEHVLFRIKSEDSMREKCRRRGLPETAESALKDLHDAIGFRVVCAFLDDVYAIRDYIVNLDGVEIIEEKDYIKEAKPNGYRSYHMIIRVRGFYAEIQLRTISMDTWAALEHHIHYKKNIAGNQELIYDELKRCADELASTDVSMQIIKNMIMEDGSL